MASGRDVHRDKRMLWVAREVKVREVKARTADEEWRAEGCGPGARR